MQPAAGAWRGEPDALHRLDVGRLRQVERHGVAPPPGYEPPHGAAAGVGEIERQEARDHLLERCRTRRRRPLQRQLQGQRPAGLQQLQVADVQHVRQGHARPRTARSPAARRRRRAGRRGCPGSGRSCGARQAPTGRRSARPAVSKSWGVAPGAGRVPASAPRRISVAPLAGSRSKVRGAVAADGGSGAMPSASRNATRCFSGTRFSRSMPRAHHARVDQGKHQAGVGQLALEHCARSQSGGIALRKPPARYHRRIGRSALGLRQQLRQNVQLAAIVEHGRRRSHGASPRST